MSLCFALSKPVEPFRNSHLVVVQGPWLMPLGRAVTNGCVIGFHELSIRVFFNSMHPFDFSIDKRRYTRVTSVYRAPLIPSNIIRLPNLLSFFFFFYFFNINISNFIPIVIYLHIYYIDISNINFKLNFISTAASKGIYSTDSVQFEITGKFG